MTLSIQAFAGGELETNTYLVADTETGEALVIDAAEGVTGSVVEALRQNQWMAQAILLTHTHWDHIADAAAMQRALNVPLRANSFAQALFGDQDGRIAARGRDDIEPFLPDGTLDEADEVTVGPHTFTVLYLPGHEPTHIAFWSEPDNVMISGDVIFPGGHGTTEIPGSDQRVMNQTIRRLTRLPDATVIYPGHGDSTTIGAERAWMTQLRSS
jgi:glyoxylase-like metal-dependent hydrolase (beta-lactamase superfamily II)